MSHSGSLRSIERLQRVRRYSPLLYAAVSRGECTPGVAERLVVFITEQTFLNKDLSDELRAEPWALEIQATYRRERAR